MTNSGPEKPELTEDAFLDGAVRLRQPVGGFRSGSDAVFLAAAVPAQEGQRVLDVGAGAGAVSFCLAARVPAAHIDGLEIQPSLAELFAGNIALNRRLKTVRIFHGSLVKAPPDLSRNAYDHVVTNPPFFDPDTVRKAADPAKAVAHSEGELDLAGWVGRCLGFLRHRGTLTLIYRTERLDDLLMALEGRAGDVKLFPLWPGAGRPSKLVLVHAVRQSRAPLTLLPGLVVHEGPERHSPEAREILRGGAALSF